MDRRITTHLGSSLNDRLTVEATSPPGTGGAPYQYEIYLDSPRGVKDRAYCELRFQQGNPADEINGISNEVLLAVVRDRLECYQRGPFACEDNAEALKGIVRAMDKLAWRSIERKDRGVEGTQNP